MKEILLKLIASHRVEATIIQETCKQGFSSEEVMTEIDNLQNEGIISISPEKRAANTDRKVFLILQEEREVGEEGEGEKEKEEEQEGEKEEKANPTEPQKTTNPTKRANKKDK